MTPVYSLALKATINEIRNISPEVSCAFVFKQDGEVIAQNDNLSQETINGALQLFNEMNNRLEAVGGLENLAIQGSNGKVNFTPCINGFYLATVSSRDADEKLVYALNRVLVPVIIKIVTQLNQNSEAQLTLEKPQPKPEEPKQEPQNSEAPKPEPVQPIPMEKIELDPPKAPVHQFMVEKIGGLMVPSDTVRIDSEVLASWNQLYEGKIIEQVSIETLKFKTTQCKFKPIKEPKNSTKGIVQIPEKIMQTLEVAKGELVMIKPVI